MQPEPVVTIPTGTTGDRVYTATWHARPMSMPPIEGSSDRDAPTGHAEPPLRGSEPATDKSPGHTVPAEPTGNDAQAQAPELETHSAGRGWMVLVSLPLGLGLLGVTWIVLMNRTRPVP